MNITSYREIPLQYSYFNGGSEVWNKYAEHLQREKSSNSLNDTITLLAGNESYFELLLAQYDQVNIVDIGVGNALPVKELLTKLIDAGKLKRYIAIDISQSMLDIAEKNLKSWFGDDINFEGYTKDVCLEPFAEVIAEPLTKGKGNVVNLLLLLGGTLSNFRTPEDALKVIRKSMGPNDLFIYTFKLDTPMNRQHFDFQLNGTGYHPLPGRFVVDLLGILPSYYVVEAGFSKEQNARFARIRFKYALTIEFKLSIGEWHIELQKDDTLILWWAKHTTAFDIASQFYDNGLNPLSTSQTATHDYMLLLSDLRKYGR